ncbi:UNVERIFIED_CONTAM: hypothetical protein K2H54_045054 [Gekko kuhli]
MKLLTAKVVALLLAVSTGVSGQKDSVSQDASASAKEGDPVQLNCSYRGTEQSLHWYKQCPGGQLHFLALLTVTTSRQYDSYVMSLDTKNKSTSLYLNSTQLHDSARYFCALEHSGAQMHPPGVRCQVEVNQSLLVFTRDGANATIACKYKTINFIGLQWYQQFPGERPTHLLTIVANEARKEPNFSADHNKEERLSRLHIAGVQHRDAATYFCAVEAQ